MQLLQERGRRPRIDVPSGLQHLAAAHGQQAKYHETVSWLYVFVIHERMAAGGHSTWDEFERSNPDLLTDWAAFVARYYSPRTLRSPIARRSFVLPDRPEALTRSSR